MDKYTAKFTYGKPKPMFIYNMTRGGTGGGATIAPLPVSPSHYMKEFHEDTTSDKAKLEADDQGTRLRRLADLLHAVRQAVDHANPDRPTLGPWVPKGTLTDELFVIERNPYFFAVDEEGQQLPYIDKVTHRLYGIARGAATCGSPTARSTCSTATCRIGDLPLYKQSEAKGDYKMVLGVLASHVAMQLNLTHQEASCSTSSSTSATCASPSHTRSIATRSTNWYTTAC